MGLQSEAAKAVLIGWRLDATKELLRLRDLRATASAFDHRGAIALKEDYPTVMDAKALVSGVRGLLSPASVRAAVR